MKKQYFTDKARLSAINEGENFDNFDLASANLKKASLNDVSFQGASLDGAEMDYAALSIAI